MPNRDTVLLETIKAHRARLLAAFLFGERTERRVANDNIRRLIGGVVLAAIACVGCVAYSFVASLQANQARAQQAQAGLGPATGPPFAADTFDRTVKDGWGTAELGGSWTLLEPLSDYAVASGAGAADLLPHGTRGGNFGSLQDRSDVSVTVQLKGGAVDGSGSFSVIGRAVNATQDYRANIFLRKDGSLTIALSRRSDLPDRYHETTLSDTVTLIGTKATDPDSERPPITARLQVVGTNPTILRAKAWLSGGSEPSGWSVQASDGEAALQRPGVVGVRAGFGPSQRPGSAAVLDVLARVAP